jgi:hypothetical protein
MVTLCAGSRIFAEMPMAPNMEELCEGSKIVLSAKCLRQTAETQETNKLKYVSTEFEIVDLYKGDVKTKIIRVLIPVSFVSGYSSHCRRFPHYQLNKKYFLFLKRVSKEDFIRIELDDIWEERAYSIDTESLIKEEIAFLADPDRWKKIGDHLSYHIDADSDEKQIELTPWQKSNRFSKRAEYWRNGKLIGERAWYENGQIAYEEPFKHGLRHGILREWTKEGRLRSIKYYRKGRLHGPLITWKGIMTIDVTYWIRGRNVKGSKYTKEAKTNRTLLSLNFR